MAYSVPLTAVSNATLTAAQWNASVRDNILETGPAKATTTGRILVTSGTNSIAERAVSTASVTTSQTTASTSYVDLTTPGPAVTVTTGTSALVLWNVQAANSTGGSAAQCGVAVSGSTTVAASDSQDVYINNTTQIRAGASQLITALNGGSNTFTMKYKVTSGTGTFLDRTINVVGL